MSVDRTIAEGLVGDVLLGNGHTFDPTRLKMAQVHATLAVATEVEALRGELVELRRLIRDRP